MVDQAEGVLKEFSLVAKDVEDLDLAIPHSFEVELAAQQRQQLRLEAVNQKMKLALAIRAGQKDMEDAAGKEFRKFVGLLTALDAEYPEALERMREMDAIQEATLEAQKLARRAKANG